MRKLFSSLSAMTILASACAFQSAFAHSAADIPADFWAVGEISQMLDNNVMTVDEKGNFNPDASVERGEFTSMLIKVLSQDKMDVYAQNPYEDINAETKYYNDIMRSEQIGLIYGYPDGTFKPEKDMIKAEVASAISHITKDSASDLTLLDNFTDSAEIPDWAKLAYAKTVQLNLFVNHPDKAKFEPQRDITRAETAVLLARLQNALSNVKDEYKAQEVEKTLGVEHLSINSHADSNIVTITNMQKIVAEGNILKVAFSERFKAKDITEGNDVVFTNEKDVVTDEGTLIIPAGSKFYASVANLVEPQKLNKAGAVKFNFHRLELPNGTVADMDADVYNKLDGYLKASSKGKVAAYTLGGLAVGAGTGVAIGAPTDEWGASLGIALPVGAVGGLATSLLTKGPSYKANQGQEVYIKLNKPLAIQESL